MDKKINLEEIIKYCVENPDKSVYKNICKDAMLEFGKQLLELAHENSEVVVDTCMGQKTGEVWVDKESVMKTLEQVI